MARPTPESLRLAADATEAAEVARQEALAQEALAVAAKAEADTADTNADAALAAAGVNGGGAGGGNNRRASISPFGGGSAIAKVVAFIALGLAILAIIFSFVLALVKPSEERVAGVAAVATEANKTANSAVTQVAAVASQVTGLKSDLATIALDVAKANDKAEEALKKPCACTVAEPAPAPVVAPKKAKKVPAGIPTVVTPQPPVVVPAPALAPMVPTGSEVCRLLSDGTARLISAPKVVLARGTVIAIEMTDSASPQAIVIGRSSGEDCNMWRARVDKTLTDHTNGRK